MICQDCRNTQHDKCINYTTDYPSCFCQHKEKLNVAQTFPIRSQEDQAAVKG